MVAADAAADLAAVTAAGLLSYYSAAVAALAVAAMKAAAAALAALAAADALALSGLSSCFAAAAVAVATSADAARNANKYVIRLPKWRRFNNHKGIALTYTTKCMFLVNGVGGLILTKALFFYPKNDSYSFV